MNPGVNPEAIIIAANAAIAAQNMSQFTAFAAGAVLLLMVLLIGLTIWMTYRFEDLRHQTNSLMEKLLVSTASDAQVRGNLAGRAGLVHEQQAAKAAGENKENG